MQLQATVDQVSKQLHETELQAAKLRAVGGVASQRTALEAELKQIDTDLQMKRVIASILQNSHFGHTGGYSGYLSAFARQLPEGAWLTGLTIAGDGSEIGLRGRTLRPELVADYVNQLKREKIMQGKDFTTLQIAVPATDASNGANAAVNNKKPTPAGDKAGYLEFELYSSDTTEKNKSSGNKDK
jgi:Tfp pilus assembly protein PilN